MSGNRIDRILLREIVDGDKRKFLAESNDSPSGGGARDIRFRPEDRFLPFLKKMFPTPAIIKGKTCYTGECRWGVADGAERRDEMEIWPATNARPNECRLAKVNKYDLYPLIQSDPNGGRSVFMLFQTTDKVVRLYFTSETELQDPSWDARVRSFVSDWLQTNVKSAFIDFVTHDRFPNV